jgi:hypothetical protein
MVIPTPPISILDCVGSYLQKEGSLAVEYSLKGDNVAVQLRLGPLGGPRLQSQRHCH